ncbi:hypothetical protein P256_00513 [Acinetobacter nectaris CIP 110549]|uniref:Major facilitator superfamily (MFS) profile domain-containing protein n=2 Tax=Acinetobacter nectaris TaxID=1219382 RepID=V2UXM6_9GAMM|nr:hypothetical protein P256_00513 [Acinetobacter nectaris CIP 110549]
MGFGFNTNCYLRTIFPSFGALMPEIKSSLHLSGGLVTLVTTLPILCLGIFAPLAPKLSEKLGIEKTILFVMIVLVVGIILRGVGKTEDGTILAGGAISIINVLLPSIIKRDFPEIIGLMSGLYAMALLGGAAFSAGITIPLEHIFNNSWTLAITMWAIPAGGAIVFWLFQSPKHIIKNHQTVPNVSGLWQCKLAWHITIFMVLQSMSSFTIFAWFALFLRDRGISSLEASLVVSISILLQTVASFVAPLIATKLKHQSWFNIAVVIMTLIGFLGCLIAPLKLIWLWSIILGIGQGALTSISMALIIFRSENTHVAAKLSSMVQTVGFGLGAFGPLIIGFVYRSPNHFLLVEVVFILIFLGLIYFGFKAGKDLYVSADVN